VDGPEVHAAKGVGKEQLARMAVLAGIDEAGFGPLLGPLVVSSSAFRVEAEYLDADLWQVLRRGVGKTRKHLAGRLLIADSKKAYKRSEGMGHLERSVLAALAALGHTPAKAQDVLTCLCPECLPRLLEYPWYEDIRRRALETGQADLHIAAQVFGDDMAKTGAKLMQLHCRCLDVAHYNTLVGHMRNKSQVLFVATTQLLQTILDECPDPQVRILVDRQGGRVHYRENLLRSFPQMELRIIHECDRRSVYELRTGSRRVELAFEVGADENHLPVSLASMVSKYVRELLMESMNGYFTRMNPALKPTAGYWTDGLRFLDELRTHVPQFEMDSHRLVRCR
jgi:ribonuclease HII